MTKEEIKKGLECCKTDWCVRCPYFEYVGCEVGLKQDALTLITEQEKEITQLKAEFKQLETNAEILARGVRDLNHENYELTEQLKETIQKFANYLKARLFAVFGTSADNVGSTQDIADVIDNFLKEYEDDE